MKTIITLFLFGSIAFGVFFLGAVTINSYGQERFESGYHFGIQEGRNRCYGAHFQCLKEGK